jgi:hypothetical protein
VAEKKPLEVGDVNPPRQLLREGQFYYRDNVEYCLRPSCDKECGYYNRCNPEAREETTVKIGPGINIREAFRARPGFKWACIDFAGIELRVAALLSGEPVWVKAFQEDRDLHSEMARVMFRTDEPDKAQRDIAKMGNFGNLYLSGVNTFWGLTTLTLNEATVAWKKWWHAVPDYKKWTVNQEAYYKKYGHVLTFFKRKREMKGMIARANSNEVTGKKGKKVGHSFCHRTACNCLTDGTYVTTTHRITTIGEIYRTGVLPGERVWNGVSSEEFTVHDAGHKEAWEIEFESGNKIYASSEHLFKVYPGGPVSTNGRDEWKILLAELILARYAGFPLKTREIEEIIDGTNLTGMTDEPDRLMMRRHLIPLGLVKKIGYRSGYIPIREKIESVRATWDENQPKVGNRLEWVPVDGLTVGMHVVQNNVIPSTEQVLLETEVNHCELLGVFVGDGCYTQIPKKAIFVVFNDHEEDSFLKTQDLLSREGYFFKSWKKDRSKEGKKPLFVILLKMDSTRLFVTRTGLEKASAQFKTVPGYVKNRGPLAWKAFLRGYRTTDGQNVRWAQRTVTASPMLADEVFQLYQALGMRPVTRRTDEDAWYVDPKERVTANEEIGWNSVSKEFEQTQSGLGVPTHLANRVGQLVFQSSQYLALEHGKQAHVHRLRAGSSSFKSVRQLAALASLDLVELRYSYDRIKSVRNTKIILPMKDIEVLTGRPEFMANGVLVHNSPIQGTSADLLKMAMTRVDDFLTKEKLRDDVKMMLTVHDELDFEIRENVAMYEILRDIGRQMTLTPKGNVLPTIPGWTIPLKVDIEIGDNWGNLVGIDDLDPATKDLPKPEKESPKKDGVTLLLSGVTTEDADKLHIAILKAANEPNVVRVPLMIRMGDRAYSIKSLEKVSEGHLRRLVQGIHGVKVL